MSQPHTIPTAIVTGAGSGVGARTAQKLAAAGWNLTLVGRTKTKLDATATTRTEACLVLPADLADPTAIEPIVDLTLTRFGRVDALINNAGMASTVPIESVTLQTLQDSFAVNTIGPGLLIAAVFPIMKKQGTGRIINVATAGIQDPFPGFFAYAAAKSALDSFTRSIENEGKAHGVRAFTIAPGAIETGMLRALFDTNTLPTSKSLDPADVAQRIVECATGQHDHHAGTTQLMIRS